MAIIFGKEYSKKELLDKAGNLSRFAGIRRIEYKDGLAAGLRAYEVINGALRFTANIDKCLDINDLYYNGVPMFFQSQPGLMNGNWFNTGHNGTMSISCGMMFTCGLSNVGNYQDMPNGECQPQHGHIRTTPAEQFGARTYWVGDDCFFELTATMREATLFGPNLVLRRTITTKLGETTINIHDEIENESSKDNVPLMLLYHCNVGFPLLDEGSTLEVDTDEVTPRDEVARTGLEKESSFIASKPIVGFAEQVFYYKPKADENHICRAVLKNPNRGLKFTIAYDNRELPNMVHWKCMDVGNYVMGIEPSNCHPEGVHKEAADGTLRRLGANEKIETCLSFSVENI